MRQRQPEDSGSERSLHGDQEAKIIALRLGPPPKGFANWTLRLLAEQAVALEIVESVSHETLRGTPRKQLHKKEDRSIGHPLEADAEFAATMEEVLDVCKRGLIHSWYPVLCMDEEPNSVAEGNADADRRYEKASASSGL